jgi:DNA polymerase elongation subunit (family B)
MAHWIKQAGGTYVPSAIVSVVCQTHEKPIPGKHKKSVLVLDYIAVYASRRRKDKWSIADFVRFNDPDAFWEWLESWSARKKKTYIFTPCVSNTLTLSGFWNLIDARGAVFVGKCDDPEDASVSSGSNDQFAEFGICPDQSPEPNLSTPNGQYHFSSLVLTGNTDIVRYRRNGKSYQWTSGKQYFEADEQSLANAFGFTWSSTVFGGSEHANSSHTAVDRARLWLTVFQHLAKWWKDIDGGPWGSTVGQLSYTLFRKTMPKHTLLKHSDTSACVLEELALFGGRASLFCLSPIGEIATLKDRYAEIPPLPPYPPRVGELCHIDVRSMYPSILAHELFPVRLIDKLENVHTDTLRHLLKEYGVIAKVVLNCTIPEYPTRKHQRILFPTGNFSTCLCGPELLHALENGQIASVQNANVYLLGRPVQEAADRLLGYRRLSQEEDNHAFELFTKCLANSLSGKFAQKRYGWKPRPDIVPERDWGQWLSVDYDSQSSVVYKAIAGMTFERIAPANTQRKMGSIYVYLTSYGRSLMRVIREELSAALVLSQDTDGLWILLPENAPVPLERICKAVAPYCVRVNKRGQDAVFFSPSHYWVDGVWTLAGFRVSSVASETLQIESGTTENPITRGADSPPSSVYYNRETRTLSCQKTEYIVDNVGSVLPPVMTMD